MKATRTVAFILVLSLNLFSQVNRIVIAAGTPEDQALTEIGKETDADKRTQLFKDFKAKFASSKDAVAYADWQLSQIALTAGDANTAMQLGEEALANSPGNLEILGSLVTVAQQLKSNAKAVEFCALGGKAYQGIAGLPRPAGVSDDDWKNQVAQAQASNRQSYEFLESSAYSIIANEQEPKAKFTFVEEFTGAFPGSQFEEAVTQQGLIALQQLGNAARVETYGEKALARLPNSIPILLMLADTYAEDARPAMIAKAGTYAEKAIKLAGEGEQDDNKHLFAGMGHSTLGYVRLKQNQTGVAITELKLAADMLKSNKAARSPVLFRLGWAYALLKRNPEAKAVLNECVSQDGPARAQCRDVLAKITAAAPR